MSGIVFFRTEQREAVTSFYRHRLDFAVWLEQDGGCTILQSDNLLLGFCDSAETETDGLVTVVLETEAAVDACHEDLADVARGPPEANEDFDIYQFFAEDPDGRTVEIQTFLESTPPVQSDDGA